MQFFFEFGKFALNEVLRGSSLPRVDLGKLVRPAVLGFFVLLVASNLLTQSLLLLIGEINRGYEKFGELLWHSGLTGYSVVFLASLLGVVFIFSPRVWQKMTGHKTTEASELGKAFTQLILAFIAERERAGRRERSSATGSVDQSMAEGFATAEGFVRSSQSGSSRAPSVKSV